MPSSSYPMTGAKGILVRVSVIACEGGGSHGGAGGRGADSLYNRN